MQNNFNKTNKIINFLDEDSIDIINENPKKDKNKIYNKENYIKEAIKNNFPFDILKMENDAILESKEEEVDKKTVFKTITLRQKRGRKPKNILNRKKDHSAKDPDNVIRKIQTHFIKFIIHLLNDIAFALDNSKKPLFQKLYYSEIRIVNFETIQKFKKFKIKELFSIFSISPRYKRTSLKNGKNINEQNLDKLWKYSEFKEFINRNFLKVFNLYYNKGNRLKSILIGGKEITLSEKTKDFSCLLKNNKQCENELLEAVELVYLNQNLFNVSLNIEEQK